MKEKTKLIKFPSANPRNDDGKRSAAVLESVSRSLKKKPAMWQTRPRSFFFI